MGLLRFDLAFQLQKGLTVTGHLAIRNTSLRFYNCF